MANTKITSRVIADDAVLTANIADANVTLAKMAANSVDSNQYVDGSIDAAHLAPAQTNITSVGTLTALTVDNININGNTITSTDSNGNITITPNGTGNVNVNTDVLAIQGTEGETASLALQCDESDDAGDEWRFRTNTNQTLEILNNISGSSVSQLTLTPHATVASSTTYIAGNVGIGAAVDTTNFGGTYTYLGVDGGSGQGIFDGQTSNTTAGETAAAFFGSTTGSSGYKLLGGMSVVNDASSSSNAEGRLVFYTASGGSVSEKMRIDKSGNVGIGQTSPSAALHIQQTSDGSGLSGQEINTAYFHNQEATAGHNYGVRVKAGSNATDYAFRVDTLATNSVFEVDGTGNVGIGTTPEAWHGDYAAIQGANFCIVSEKAAGASKSLTLAYNTYIDSGNAWTYINSDEASNIQQYNGNITFSTAVAGSADADITFITGVRINNGTPADTLVTNSNGYVDFTGASNLRVTLGTQGTAGTNDSNWVRGDGTSIGYNCASNKHYWEIGGSSAMQLSTNKKLCIGTDQSILDDQGLSLVNTSNGFIGLFRNTYASDAGPQGLLIDHSANAQRNQNQTMLKCEDSSGALFQVFSDGELWQQNGGSTINSDERLKTDIVDASSKLSDVMNLKVRNFRMTAPSNTKKQIGFIAQEMETVFPSLVVEHNIAKDGATAIMRKGIQQAGLIPILTKAIQELKTELDAAKARIAALEA